MSVDGRHDKSLKKTDSILRFEISTKISDLCHIKMEDILVAFKNKNIIQPNVQSLVPE